MRRFSLVVLLALPAFTACQFTFDRDLTPGEIRGTVVVAGVDGARTPASGARIRIEGSGANVRSDAQGRFVLRGLPVGRYAYVEFSATGTTGAAKKLLLLAMRDRSRSEVVFVMPERSSAFLLRTSGAHTLLRDPGSL